MDNSTLDLGLPLSIRLPKTLHDELRALSKRRSLKLATVIRFLVVEACESDNPDDLLKKAFQRNGAPSDSDVRT